MGTKRYALVLLLASVVFAENFIQQNDQLHRLMDPFVPGDLLVNHTAYRQVLNLFLDTNIDVYAPNATGNFPVLYFATGFGGMFSYTALKEPPMRAL